VLERCLEEDLDIQVKPKARGLELYPTHNSRKHTETLHPSSPPPTHTTAAHDYTVAEPNGYDSYGQVLTISKSQQTNNYCNDHAWEVGEEDIQNFVSVFKGVP